MKKKILLIGKSEEKESLMIKVETILQVKYELNYFVYGTQNNLDKVVGNFPVVIMDSTLAATAGAQIYRKHKKQKILFITLKNDFQKNMSRLSKLINIGNNWKLCLPDDKRFLDTVKSAMNVSYHAKKLQTQLFKSNSISEEDNDDQKEQKTPYYRKLLEAEEDVKKKNLELQTLTVELQKKIKQLEKWEKLTVGRELRIIELKKKVKELQGEGK
jgi:hypothetical protein